MESRYNRVNVLQKRTYLIVTDLRSIPIYSRVTCKGLSGGSILWSVVAAVPVRWLQYTESKRM